MAEGFLRSMAGDRFERERGHGADLLNPRAAFGQWPSSVST
jgi:hypothetical protein